MIETQSDLSRGSPPSFLKWAQTLSYLLEDREGVELFKRYVESEGGISADRLNFYFACEGLKQQTDPEKVKSMIGAIYRWDVGKMAPIPSPYTPTGLVLTEKKIPPLFFNRQIFKEKSTRCARGAAAGC